MMWMIFCLFLLAGLALAEGGSGTGEGTEDPPAGAQKTETPPAELTIPKARFDEVNKRLKEAEKRLSELDALTKAAEEQNLASQKKWEELANTRAKELESLKMERDQLQARQAERERFDAFSQAAIAAHIPSDRLNDAYRLAEFGEGEIDHTAVVKSLIEGKPWLVGTPSSPETNAQRGRGNIPESESERAEYERLMRESSRFMPQTMLRSPMPTTVPARS